jgi:formylglycine-generating enzyme required for sulfatase activity
MTFSFIPPGSFLMGSDHPKGRPNETPVHRVTLTKGFFLGIHPVTQAQWKAITNAPPSWFKGDNRPVENVPKIDRQDFYKKLTVHVGERVTVGLPSEAEWEYACRAGTTTEYHFGDVITADFANYYGKSTWNGSPEGTSREETTEVGSFPPNPWGLFDMHGNVWEWCQDGHEPYSADDQIDLIQLVEQPAEPRALRGGSWGSAPVDCRTAYRFISPSANRNGSIGFRCVLRLD